ncbi:MAG: hypothetical protein N2747_10850 [Chitinophagaceae bacterium]|nr:hypothetical protein [Chitinophagaceae bacterium]
MKRMKKPLKTAGLSLLAILLLLITAPFLFKKQILTLVKREINKQLDATIDFSDVSVSLIRHFPKATIRIKDISIAGKEDFSGDTLFKASSVDATADIISVIKGKDINIQGVFLNQPHIRLLVNSSGKANWNIVKTTPDTSAVKDTAPSPFRLMLNRYKITDGELVYDDKTTQTYLSLKELNHSGRGDMTENRFTLATFTESGAVRFIQNGLPYLFDIQTELKADIQADNTTQTYKVENAKLQLNALTISCNGQVNISNPDSLYTDFSFSSPSQDFKDIFSLIPAVFTRDFSSIKTGGNFSLQGWIKGYITSDRLPAYDLKLNINNAFFQYPDLPKPVKNIQLNVHAQNPDGKPDNAVINIPKGHLELDKEPFDFHFVYKNPETVQWLDAGIKGKINLADITQFIQLPSGTKLGGLIFADAFVKGPLRAIEKQSGPFQAGGFFDISGLFFSSREFPHPVQNGNLKVTLNHQGGSADNTVIHVQKGHVEVAGDPVDFSLHLTRPVSAAEWKGDASARITLEKFSQFLALPAGSSLSGKIQAQMNFQGSNAALAKKEYRKILFNGNAEVSQTKYVSKEYPGGIMISSAALCLQTANITVSGLSGEYLNTKFNASGSLENYMEYLFAGAPLKLNLTVSADKMNLNDWMGTAPPASASQEKRSAEKSTGAQPFIVPGNIHAGLNASVQKVNYDNVEYENISGFVELKDETVWLRNLSAEALEGNFTVNGSYSTKNNKQKPEISLSYDIRNLNVQKAFYAYNTARFLMPVGKFLAGRLHSRLSMTGNLDEMMTPLLNSLTGKGNLLLVEGILEKFAPLEKVAEALDIDRLKSITMKEIKNTIEFANGKVFVKPFSMKVKEIDMEISGFHGLDQSLDYNLKMKVPRSLMGTKGNAMVNNLVAKAQSKGIPVSAGEYVNLLVKVTGTVSKPEVQVNLEKMAGEVLKQAEEQVKEFVKAKADSLAGKAKDTLKVIKKQVEEKVKEKIVEAGIDTAGLNIKNVKDTLKERIKDTLKQRAKDTLKKKLKNIFFKEQN